MDTEAYQFTVYTMLIGMFIVFLAMIVFSLIMYLLDVTFRDRSAKASGAGKGPASGQDADRRPAVAEAGGPIPPWAMVAVAAYLTAEPEVRGGPSAEAWRPEVNHYDPWLAGGQHTRRRVERVGV